ncbi:MAG: EF-P lysine aminoacylase EpmA [Nevskiaceae bacterium]
MGRSHEAKTMTWRPSASLETLRARAELLARMRTFFAARGVMEVDTPVLSAHGTVDVHIDSLRTADGRWLQTSPEFAMKRLLAAGSGPIYQLGHVFRAGDLGRNHNPEFLMLEWYRPGFDHHRLMDEMIELLITLGVAPAGAVERISYRDAWREIAGVDPLTADAAALGRALGRHEHAPEHAADFDRDAWLDFGMGFVVGPELGHKTPVFVYDFPASQAALARVRPGPPPVAERFELIWKGLELANGFHELGDAAEQRARFESDRARREQAGRETPAWDAHLVEALAAGLPHCAGVALGVDRLLMLLLGLPEIGAAMPFAWDRA